MMYARRATRLQNAQADKWYFLDFLIDYLKSDVDAPIFSLRTARYLSKYALAGVESNTPRRMIRESSLFKCFVHSIAARRQLADGDHREGKRIEFFGDVSRAQFHLYEHNNGALNAMQTNVRCWKKLDTDRPGEWNDGRFFREPANKYWPQTACEYASPPIML